MLREWCEAKRAMLIFLGIVPNHKGYEMMHYVIRTKIMSALIVFLSFAQGAQASGAEDALKFMLAGDKIPEKNNLLNLSLDNCFARYQTDFLGVRVTFTHDFNRAIWSSASYPYINNMEMFSVNCSDECTYMNGEGSDAGTVDYVLLTLGMSINPAAITFPIQVSRQRFVNALKDFSNACPGTGSKY